MRLLYTLSVHLYYLAIRFAAFSGNSKAQKWINGRSNWQNKLKDAIPKGSTTIWFHAASLGEFEQGRPLIEKFKKEKPSVFILLSFFSPSGYEVQKNYNYADHICYLPLDTPQNAQLFIKIVEPKLVLFVKYEFWFNILDQLRKQEVKSYLVSGIFRPSQHFFKWYGSWFRKQLLAFDKFYLQNEASQQLLQNIGFKNTSLTGDTRFDRVFELAQQSFENNRFTTFCKNSETLIIGSSWKKEDEFAEQLHSEKPQLKLIIAPHENEANKMHELKAKFNSSAILWSETSQNQDLSSSQVLIIDQIGMLSKVYRFADVALIGGGFGAGIHNILEAAVYGCPVLFGPNYQKFQEAKELIEQGAAFSISNYDSFKEQLEKLLQKDSYYTDSSNNASAYVHEKSGASEQIFLDLESAFPNQG